MTLVYATLGELTIWTGTTPPANASALLRSASMMVTEATITDYYAVDDTGAPTDPGIIQAFSDATCAQCAAWISAGIDPAIDGLGIPSQGAPVRSKTLDGGAITYDTSLVSSPQVLAARQQLATRLCDEAVRILQDAQLLSTAAWIVG